ncbi:MAG TPA: hypothetical protein VM469_12440 [Pseudoxanthomonas sp.]|nr:hypothetical protein [Pseudoxanthomonas sp.]
MNFASARSLSATAFVVLLLAGCSPSQPSTESKSGTDDPASAVSHAAGEVALELPYTDASVRTLVGTKQADALVATGAAGVLAFGPYRALGAGHYQLTVEGGTSKPVTVDVISAKGKQVHAKQQVVAATKGQPLAVVSFDLDQPVADLEVRLFVPANSEASLSSYKIVYR